MLGIRAAAAVGDATKAEACRYGAGTRAAVAADGGTKAEALRRGAVTRAAAEGGTRAEVEAASGTIRVEAEAATEREGATAAVAGVEVPPIEEQAKEIAPLPLALKLPSRLQRHNRLHCPPMAVRQLGYPLQRRPRRKLMGSLSLP